MASSYSPNKNYELITTGEQTNTWGVTLNNANFSVMDLNFGGRLTKSVAGSSDVTLTSTEARNVAVNCTGVLTGNINLIVPNAGSYYFVANNTTGAFTLTVKPSGGTGIVVPQGQKALLFANPTTTAMEDYIGRLTGQGWQREVTVTSAATTDILGAASDLILITGNTGPITSLGTGTWRKRWVRFDSTPTLTYNATSLILPGNANIVAAAGDTMLVESDDSSNARVMAYFRRAVVPVVTPGTWTTIASGSIAAAATQAITSIPATYRALQLVVLGASSDTNTRRMQVRISTDNGSNYISTNYGGITYDGTVALATSGFLAGPSQASGTAGTIDLIANITGYQGGAYLQCSFSGRYSGGTVYFGNSAYFNGTTAVNALQLLWDSTGNFDAGTYALYGMV